MSATGRLSSYGGWGDGAGTVLVSSHAAASSSPTGPGVPSFTQTAWPAQGRLMATARGIDRTRPENRAGGTGRGGHDDDGDTGPAGGGVQRVRGGPAGCAGCGRRPSLSRSSAPWPVRPLRRSARAVLVRGGGPAGGYGCVRRVCRIRRVCDAGLATGDRGAVRRGGPHRHGAAVPERRGRGHRHGAHRRRTGPHELPRRRGRRHDHGDRRDDRPELPRDGGRQRPVERRRPAPADGGVGPHHGQGGRRRREGRRRRDRGGQRRGDRLAHRRRGDHLVADARR